MRSAWLLSAFLVLGAAGCIGFYFLTAQFGTFAAAFLLLSVLPILIAVVWAQRKLRVLQENLAWWQVLWILLFLSEITGLRVRTIRDIEQTVVDSWAICRIILVGIVAFVLASRLALRKTAWIGSLLRGLVAAIAIYALISAGSTLWSAYPAWTLYKSLEYLVDVTLLAAILATVSTTESYKWLFDCTYTLYGLLLACVWLGAVLWPNEAFQPTPGLLQLQLIGTVPEVAANSVGQYSGVLAIVALTRLLFGAFRRHTGRVWYCLLLIGSLITLTLSQTRSAVAGFLAALVVVSLLSERKGAKAVLSLTAVTLLLTPFYSVFWTYIRRGQDPQLWNTLSGRLEYWEFAWKKFAEEPLIGYGGYAAGRFVVLAGIGDQLTSSVHNTYIEILVGVGLLGLIPVLVALLGGWWFLIGAARNFSLVPFDRQLALEAAGILATLTVRSFFTTELIWHPPLFFLLVLGYAEFLRRRSQFKPRGALQPEF